jgi:hypothetical protein
MHCVLIQTTLHFSLLEDCTYVSLDANQNDKMN